MKIIIIFSFVLIFFISNFIYLYPQSVTDTSHIPTQYRRGTEIPQGYQSYEQKYLGKDIQEEKRRIYPLDRVTSGTGIWTELNPKVPRVDYLGIHFVNIDTGWACSKNNSFVKIAASGVNSKILRKRS